MQVTHNPLAGYAAADVDIAADTKYYGFTGPGGVWYILEEVTSEGTFRYTTGAKGGYAAAWTDRANKTYGYYHLVI